ncbi:MAG: hypothetical protein JNG85_07750 [Spirochaetaceae bacterium]|nr:hypothetical protein [Spirochaetaceae bacterium]
MSRAASAIQADLDGLCAMRSAAIANGGIYEYSIDSGQGRQSVKRMTLLEIGKAIRELEAELLDASDTGNTFPVRFDRG